MSLYVPNVDELIALERKTSHPSRKTRLTRAAIEATLLSQSGENLPTSTRSAYTKKAAMMLAADLVADRAFVVAQDDFFPSIRNHAKARVQQGNARKRELTADISGTRVALASCNYHHRHFGTEFAFDADAIVVSGCAGFGLERWLATVRQAGTLQ